MHFEEELQEALGLQPKNSHINIRKRIVDINKIRRSTSLKLDNWGKLYLRITGVGALDGTRKGGGPLILCEEETYL